MTRRERLEAKIERRRDWAEGRARKATALLKRNEPFRGDIAFNTQPGHIPERARVIAREDRAFEHREMATHHEAKADGLERQLERSVFSDDEDASAKLEERIAEREALQAHMKAVNVAIRKVRKAHHGFDEAAILMELVIAGIITDAEGLMMARSFALVPYHGLGYPSYELTNNNANIRKDRGRIEDIKRRAVRAAEADAAGGVLVKEHGDYVSVTFAEKPEYSIIEALKLADFHWSGGSWYGKVAALPACVRP